MDKEELYGEDRLAAETRIRNLLWTVSGDYDLSCELDIDSFQNVHLLLSACVRSLLAALPQLG